LLTAKLLSPAFTDADECHVYFIEIVLDTTVGVYVEFFLLKRGIGMLRHFGCNSTANDLSDHCTGDSTPPETVTGALSNEALRVPLGPSGNSGAALADGTGGQTRSHELERGDTGGTGSPDPGSQQTWREINWRKYWKQVSIWVLVVASMKFVMVGLLVLESPQLIKLSDLILHGLDPKPQWELIVVMVVTPCIMNSLQFWLQDNIFVEQARKAQLDIQSERYDQGLERLKAERMRQSLDLQEAKQREQQLLNDNSHLQHEHIKLQEAYKELEIERDLLKSRLNSSRRTGFMDAIWRPLVQRREVELPHVSSSYDISRRPVSIGVL